MIKIFKSNLNSENRYILELFSFFSQTKIQYVDTLNNDVIFFSNKPENNCIWFYNENAKIDWDIYDPNESSFDLQKSNFLKACADLIYDKVNKEFFKNNSNLDKHNRLLYENSFQDKAGYNAYPIVNYIFRIFSQFCNKKLYLKLGSYLPKGIKAIVVLSHDVDNPIKYPAVFENPLKHGIVDSLKSHILYFLDPNKDDYFNFKIIRDIENSYGFKSTFYFQSINRFTNIGNKHDVTYDIKTKKIQKEISDLINDGFEVGMHPSYKCYEKKEYYIFQKKELENITKKNVISNRHHLWSMGIDKEESLVKISESGFLIDSSIAFNDHHGFRRSIALPYNPIQSHKNKKLLEIPVMLMDGNFFYKNDQIDDLIDVFKKQLDILKLESGIGSLNWHDYTSVPRSDFYKWGLGYIMLLEILHNDKEVIVMSNIEFNLYIKSLDVNIF
tara:strand:- start:1142 stop:2470 length:1329 start_codon:yes stop_codon:yes gene_type:complete